MGGLLLVCGALGYWFVATRYCTRLPLAPRCVQLLFIGNSYTFTNDLPGVFSGLARAGGHPVETGMAAAGGWSLADHAASAPTLSALQSSPWQYVVLQEQSQIPAVPRLRTAAMYPAARTLARAATAAGATPIFLLTWGHRDGWPEQGMAGYQQMQNQLNQGYQGIAHELGAPIAPVGEAWSLVHAQRPALELWQPDGSHPSQQGTYLAACVLYATIFQRSPQGLSYTAGLPAATAEYLQAVAAGVVLDSPAQWNLQRTQTR